MSFDTLAPWDANRWFDLPLVSGVGVAAVAVQAIKANPQRVGIIFSWSTTGANVFVSPDPNSIATTKGIVIPQNGQPLQILHKDWAILVQCEWWAISSGVGGVLSVIELVLRGYPKREDATANGKTVPRPTYRIGRDNRFSVGPVQWTPRGDYHQPTGDEPGNNQFQWPRRP